MGLAGNSSAEVGAQSLPNDASQALSVLLKMLGGHVDAATIANEYPVDRGEQDAAWLARAAKESGFRARVIESDSSRLDKLALPALAQSRDGGFFILASVRNEHALVHSPPYGPRTVTISELDEFWSGLLVQVAKSRQLLGKSATFGLRWFLPAFAKYKGLLCELLLASALIGLFALAIPIFFQVIVDKVLVHRGLTTLDVLVLAMIGVVVFDVTLGGLRSFVFSHTACRVDVQLGAKLFSHLLALPQAYFDSRPSGQTVARMRELETIRDVLMGSALTVVVDLAFALGFLLVMWHYSSTLTWIVLATIPAYALITYIVNPILRARAEERFQRSAQVQAFLFENVSAMETVKTMAVEPQARRHWESLLAEQARANLNQSIASTSGGQAIQLVSRLGTVLILWIGAKAVIGGQLSVGQLVAFNMLASQFSGPVLRLAQLWQDLTQFRISLERLGDLLNHPTESLVGRVRGGPKLKGGVSFDNVSFRYPEANTDALNEFNLEIEPGEVVALVGRSGSGKSTVSKLVQRLHVPTSGRVRVDGVDLAHADPRWLRRQIGVVMQDSVLFSCSVKENIALAEPTASIEKIMAVAELAGAHEFISALPDGYNTVLHERGENISGGQRQRIAIARALLSNPKILILDEATSALDAEAEQRLMRNLQLIAKGRTVIIIAHRLSTVRRASRIVMLDNGHLSENGSHDALLSDNGAYANLWRHQNL